MSRIVLNQYKRLLENKNFKNDLKNFLEIDKEYLQPFFEKLDYIIEDNTNKATEDLVNNLVNATGLEEGEVLSIINIFGMFSYFLIVSPEINTNSIIKSLLKKKLLSKDKKSGLLNKLELLQNEIKNNEDLEKIVLSSLNDIYYPRFINIKSSVALKAINDINDNMKYFLPIASISISAFKEKEENIYFQANIRDIKNLIKQFKKIEKNLIKIEEKSKDIK